MLRRSESLLSRSKRALSEPSVIYQTSDTDQPQYEYIDSNLKPYTNYQYQIRAVNSKGSTESPWQSVDTLQAKPDGLAPPIVSYVQDRFDKVWMDKVVINALLLRM